MSKTSEQIALEAELAEFDAKRKQLDDMYREAVSILNRRKHVVYTTLKDSYERSPLRHDLQQYTECCLRCGKNVYQPLVDPTFCLVKDLPDWAKPARDMEHLRELATHALARNKK